jgi:Cysteine-rich secretory protein family
MATLAALPSPSPSRVRVDMTPAAGSGWLDRFNTWRGNAGLASLTENTGWSAGDYNHALYMVKNDLVTHYETPGVPYYTTAGDQAAQNSNIEVSSFTSTTDEQAIDWWMGAPFHAMNMMDPRLTSTGYGSYRQVKSGWQAGFALDTIRGNSFSGGTYPVYWPGNGTTEPLTSYSGYEYPDPLQACKPYTMPAGLPIFIEVGGSVSTNAGPVHTFTGNGVPLNHCIIDSTNSYVGSYLQARGGVILMPQQPLQNGVKYVAALTVNGVAYTWSFTVGAFNACTSVSATSSPPSPSPPGTTITFNAVASGCQHPNPLYQYWMLAPGSSTWQVAQPYSPNATFTWSTTGKGGGTYLFSVWARDAGSPGAFGDSLGRWDASNNGQYTLSFTACAGVTALESPPSPSITGTTVAITGSASICPNPLYQYWMLAPGSSTWQLAQAYSKSATFSWNTTGLAGGIYRFSIWAKDVASPGTSGDSLGRWDATSNGQYTLSTPCSSVTTTAAPPSPAARGTAVSLTSATAGCPNPQYEFWMLAPGSSTWLAAQSYSTNATFKWSTTGKAAGVYRFSVWARDASSTGTNGDSLGRWDTSSNLTYTLT